MAASNKKTELRVGRLTKAHGLKGALKVELYTDDPASRFTPGAVFTLQVPAESPWSGKTVELAELRWYNQQPVAFFVGVDDRTAAETLVKAILWVSLDPDALPEEEDAWYDHQLVGLRVVRDGHDVGRVARVDHFPAQDLLIVTTASGDVMVPFVSAIVPSVDVVAGIVTITPPDGLLELGDDTSSGDAAAEGSPTDDAPVEDAAASAEDAPVEGAPVEDAAGDDASAPVTDAAETDRES